MFGRAKRLDDRSDDELVAIYRERPNPRIWDELCGRYIPILYAWSLNWLKNPQDSEDATMDILLDLPNKVRTYQIESFKNWLFLVCRNHCLQKLKKSSKLRTELIDEIYEINFMENGPDDTLDIEEERLSVMGDAIDQLKPAQKQCLVLFYFQKHSYKEIVEITGIEHSKVKSHIQNGKRNLKNLIENLR